MVATNWAASQQWRLHFCCTGACELATETAAACFSGSFSFTCSPSAHSSALAHTLTSGAPRYCVVRWTHALIMQRNVISAGGRVLVWDSCVMATRPAGGKCGYRETLPAQSQTVRAKPLELGAADSSSRSEALERGASYSTALEPGPSSASLARVAKVAPKVAMKLAHFWSATNTSSAPSFVRLPRSASQEALACTAQTRHGPAHPKRERERERADIL